MAFAPFRNESYQRINFPIRTNMRGFWLVQALHYQPNGFSITPKPDKSLNKMMVLSDVLTSAAPSRFQMSRTGAISPNHIVGMAQRTVLDRQPQPMPLRSAPSDGQDLRKRAGFSVGIP